MGQNNLGIMYMIGEGIEQDFAEAVEYFEKAAKGN
ncbi:MAG: SEL1-like repeat protein [Bacteroidales bacterium]|jgi:TPR repeat protein|nr:SEL1-like repeat protein [Bacteroidales bacterium]